MKESTDSVNLNKPTHQNILTSSDEFNQDLEEDMSDEMKKKSDTDSSLERSFEVIPSNSCDESTNQDPTANQNEVTTSSECLENRPSRSQSNNSLGLGGSIQQKLKNSGSFFSKTLHTSALSKGEIHSDRRTSIPSGIANALSSISTLTSSLTQSNTSQNNHNQLNTSLSSSNSGANISIDTIVSNVTKTNGQTREDIFLKKAALERKNLINLTRLIVKDLISSTLTITRTIEDCSNAIHLKNYFVLIERVLKHGLKDSNVFSGRSSNLWQVLESLPKYSNEATLIAESVRSLANTKSSDGRVRAWMRLAMMQKKLPEYFNDLLANKEVLLRNIYYDYAFMLNEEAHIFAGLLIGVNVIDCNFFIKDANFDHMDDIIELGPYLRYSNGSEYDGIGASNNEGTLSENDLWSILDQKNYLEEWNKRLEGTVLDLQRKIRTLEDHNSHLEMEAKLSEIRVSNLQSATVPKFATIEDQSLTTTNNNNHEGGVASTISGAIKSIIGSSESSSLSSSYMKSAVTETRNNISNDQFTNSDLTEKKSYPESQLDDQVKSDTNSKSDTTNAVTVEEVYSDREEKYKQTIEKLEIELSRLRERTSILESSYRSSLEKVKRLEADLDIQTSMNADKETTIKIYEKDVRDKQAQVDNLRNSLNDAKNLNSNINERLQETSTKLKERLKMVTTLQANLDKWKLENSSMASRLQDKSIKLKTLNGELEKSSKQIDELKQYNIKINDELKRERESGQCSTVTLEVKEEKIKHLSDRLASLEKELDSLKPYKKQAEELKNKSLDYEQSLEEMGARLRESRLEIDTLKENSSLFMDSQWMDDKQVKECSLCQQSFSVTRRKHHCRLCGNVFCQSCSDNKMELASSSKPVRVCDTCHSFLLAKFVKTSAHSHIN